MEKITIITAPLGNSLVKKIRHSFNHPRNTFGGPDAVARSLTAGFKNLGVSYNYNPSTIKEIGKTVIVLSSVKALKQVIALKKEHRIRTIFAGPNLVIFPTDEDSILESKAVDKCLVPSKYVKNLYIRKSPSLKNHIIVWPAGVDERYWRPPSKKPTKRNAVLYFKNTDTELYKSAERILKKYNWNPIKIIYGKYLSEEFRKALSSSQFMVFLSRGESQGIALAESWAMDVPTLVWNPKTLIIKGERIYNYSSAPYLTGSTGMKWKKIEDFESIIEGIDNKLKTFLPRGWILSNMTDTKSAEILLSAIKNTK